MTTITIFQGDNVLFSKVLEQKITNLGGGLQAKLYRDGSVRLSNGNMEGDRLGVVKFDRIEVKYPRSSLSTVYGNGNECILPRHAFRMRSKANLDALRNKLSPETFTYGGHTYRFPAHLRAVSAFWDYPLRHHGMWEVMGERQPDAPGMRGIEPLSGFQASAFDLVRRSDAIMNRTPLDAFKADGTMWFTTQVVNDDRGWQQTTQISQVQHLVGGVYRPLEYNEGVCAYQDDLAGINRYDGELPSNQQHGIRTLAALIAAANCGDEIAKDDLAVYAHDAQLYVNSLPTPAAHTGSNYYGTRSSAWRAWAWMHSPATFDLARKFVVDSAITQMFNGFAQNVPSTDPFSPTPASFGIAVNKQVAQVMEHDFWLYVVGSFGRLDIVRQGLTPIFESNYVKTHKLVPKFAVVGVNGHVVPAITEWAGDPGFSVWIALGVIAALDPNAADWKRWVLEISYPGKYDAAGNPKCAGSLAELATWMRHHDESNITRSQTVMLLAVLESQGL